MELNILVYQSISTKMQIALTPFYHGGAIDLSSLVQTHILSMDLPSLALFSASHTIASNQRTTL